MIASFSLIIPSYKDTEYLKSALESIAQASTLSLVQEILVIDDGSGEADKYYKIAADFPYLPIRIISTSHQGRFLARYEGVRASKADWLIFMDTRVRIDPATFSRLQALLQQYPIIMANVKIAAENNSYSLYWERAHRWFFRSHFESVSSIATITPDNFDKFLKGTTFFAAPKKSVLDAYQRILPKVLQNDDTPLFLEMCKVTPITVHPDIYIHWQPRENLQAFLGRLWQRGPSFVEYYFRNSHFLNKLLWLNFVLYSLLLVSFAWPRVLGSILALAVLALATQAVIMSKSIGEWMQILPLHGLSIFTFSTSVYLATWRRIIAKQ
jgi:glycosyltransferase involved in cell wall biosynthesis